MTDMQFLCYCDDCGKSKLVERVKITRGAKMLVYLECGHVFGFAFLDKLVPIKKDQMGV